MLYLRQYITSANHEFRSPMEFNDKKPLAAEVDRVKGLTDEATRKAASDRLVALLGVLKSTRAEALRAWRKSRPSLRNWSPQSRSRAKPRSP